MSHSSEVVGQVAELWRYPVKSMAGSRLIACDLEKGGVPGDRAWAVREEAKGELIGGKRLPGLMLCSAAYDDAFQQQGEPCHDLSQPVEVTMPDGRRTSTTDADIHAILSQHMGRELTMCPLQPASNREHYQLEKALTGQEIRRQLGVEAGDADPDFSEMSLGLLKTLSKYVTPPGTYFDAFPLHVLTTASLNWIGRQHHSGVPDVQRFRPNILVQTPEHMAGLVEFAWCGGLLHIGDAVIQCEIRTIRCAMPAYAQPELAKDSKLLRVLRDEADRHLGIYASVLKPGRIAVGDPVLLEMPKMMGLRKGMRALRKRTRQRILSVWSRMI